MGGVNSDKLESKVAECSAQIVKLTGKDSPPLGGWEQTLSVENISGSDNLDFNASGWINLWKDLPVVRFTVVQSKKAEFP